MTALIPDNIGNAPWFSIVEQAGDDARPGGGIVAVVVRGIVPQDVANSVSITFEDTEFKFTSDTPLDIDDTKVNFGGSVVNDSTGYTNATSRAGVTGANRIYSDHRCPSKRIYNREFCVRCPGQVRQ